MKLVCKILIVVRDLLSEIAAACVDDKVLAALVVYVYLDEVVAAAERAYASLEALCIIEMTVAVKLCKLRITHYPALVYVLSCRDILSYCLVELLEVYIELSKLHRQHSAADVNSHDIGYDHLTEVCRKSDNTALSCMDIGHDAYPAALCKGLAAKQLYLLRSGVLDDVGVYNGGAVLAFYGIHVHSPFTPPLSCGGHFSASIVLSWDSRPLPDSTEMLPTFSQMRSMYSSSLSL